jgi:serine/threonine protein kinase
MNKYEIIGIVGEGAYGVVYKAKHKETGEFGMLSRILTLLNSRHQEIQGVRRRWDRQKDNYAWS